MMIQKETHSHCRFGSLRELLTDSLQRLFGAESRFAELWMDVSNAARSPSLRAAMQEQFTDAIGRAARLEVILQDLGADPDPATGDGLEVLVEEVRRTINAPAAPTLRDAALIAAVQTLKHCQIASYGTTRSFAARLDLADAARTLQHSLEEEVQADQKLTQLAERLIYPESVAAEVG